MTIVYILNPPPPKFLYITISQTWEVRMHDKEGVLVAEMVMGDTSCSNSAAPMEMGGLSGRRCLSCLSASLRSEPQHLLIKQSREQTYSEEPDKPSYQKSKQVVALCRSDSRASDHHALINPSSLNPS